jgi:hypothetical protein
MECFPRIDRTHPDAMPSLDKLPGGLCQVSLGYHTPTIYMDLCRAALLDQCASRTVFPSTSAGCAAHCADDRAKIEDIGRHTCVQETGLMHCIVPDILGFTHK